MQEPLRGTVRGQKVWVRDSFGGSIGGTVFGTPEGAKRYAEHMAEDSVNVWGGWGASAAAEMAGEHQEQEPKSEAENAHEAAAMEQGAGSAAGLNKLTSDRQ